MQGESPKFLLVSETSALGDRRFVAVVQFERQRFLIGSSPFSVTLLARLSDAARKVARMHRRPVRPYARWSEAMMRIRQRQMLQQGRTRPIPMRFFGRSRAALFLLMTGTPLWARAPASPGFPPLPEFFQARLVPRRGTLSCC